MLWLKFPCFVYIDSWRKEQNYSLCSSFLIDKSSHQEEFLTIFLGSEYLENGDTEKVDSSMASLSLNMYLTLLTLCPQDLIFQHNVKVESQVTLTTCD